MSTMIDLDPRTTTLRLNRHQHFQFTRLHGWIVRAVEGSLWITQDGDRRDVILTPGEVFHVDRDTPVVIGALEDAGIDLYRPHAVHAAHQARHAPRSGFLQRLLGRTSC